MLNTILEMGKQRRKGTTKGKREKKEDGEKMKTRKVENENNLAC